MDTLSNKCGRKTGKKENKKMKRRDDLLVPPIVVVFFMKRLFMSAPSPLLELNQAHASIR